MNLSPKKRFHQNKSAAEAHAELVSNQTVQDSLQVALAQMVMELPRCENPAKAWDSHSQLEGAKRFINIWLNLGDINAAAPGRPSSDNLHQIE